MKSEIRNQKSETNRRMLDGRTPTFIMHPSHFSLLLPAFCFLISNFCFQPSAFAATHVTGTYSLGANPSVMATVNGTPEYGLVFVQRNKLVTYNGVQYGTQVTHAYLDASGQINDSAGHLWIDLIPSTTASPADSYYVVTVNIQGTVHSEIWVVPDTATLDVALVRQAQPFLPAAPVSFYQVMQQAGSDLPQRLKLNMTGSGVTCSDNAGTSSTDCSVTGGGAGSAPMASATTSGTVKTDATAADPVVYLKTSADTLLSGKANSSHAHAESEVTSLTTDLAAKAPLSHSHAESDVTSLVTDLAAKVPTSRTVSTTAPLSGGGALSGNLTLSIPAASGSQDGYLSAGNWTTFNSKENALTFSSPLSRAANAISCPTCELTGNKNAASGYAGLDASGKISGSQIPFGTTASTAAQGNDSRITGAEQAANKNAANGYSGLDSGSKISASQIPNPGATTLGGLKTKDCTGVGHVLSLNNDGTATCSADAGGGGGASTGDSFITLSHDADLTGERVLTAGSGITLTDGGANSAATVAYNPLDKSYVQLREEFCGGSGTSAQIGELGWQQVSIGSSGLTMGYQAGTLPNFCETILTTSATSGRGGTLYLGQGQSALASPALGNSSLPWEAKFIFHVDSTASTQLYIGYLFTGSSVTSANFFGLRLDTAASSPGADSAFSFVACKSSTCSRHATTYTADTNSHTVDLKWDGSSTLTFTFDANASICMNSGGTGGCTATSNIPTTSGTFGWQLVENSSSAQHLYCDFFAFTITGLTR